MLRVILETLTIEAMFNKIFPLLEGYTSSLMMHILPKDSDDEVSVSNKLEIITLWLSSLQLVLEKYEARKHFGFLCIIQSAKYCSMLKSVIVLGR